MAMFGRVGSGSSVVCLLVCVQIVLLGGYNRDGIPLRHGFLYTKPKPKESKGAAMPNQQYWHR